MRRLSNRKSPPTICFVLDTRKELALSRKSLVVEEKREIGYTAPVRLKSERAWRTYHGGRLIDESPPMNSKCLKNTRNTAATTA